MTTALYCIGIALFLAAGYEVFYQRRFKG